MPKGNLTELTARLTKAFGPQLVSAILYGSAAASDAEDRASDVNVLCVLRQIGPDELASAEPILRWWRADGNGPVLLLTEEEVRTATDSFPMEFHDLQEHRQILAGTDVVAGLSVDDRYYRAHVEHELRAKLLRLRHQGAEFLPDAKRLTRLMSDALSTFCVLGRHALILGGYQPHWRKADVLKALETACGQPFAAMSEILAIRTSPGLSPADARRLFGQYLTEIDRLVRFVDALGHA